MAAFRTNRSAWTGIDALAGGPSWLSVLTATGVRNSNRRLTALDGCRFEESFDEEY